jgi:hypothetical protein
MTEQPKDLSQPGSGIAPSTQLLQIVSDGANVQMQCNDAATSRFVQLRMLLAALGGVVQALEQELGAAGKGPKLVIARPLQ